LFDDFLKTLISNDYSGRIVQYVSISSGDIGIGAKVFSRCACLGVSATGVAYTCTECGRDGRNYLWAQAGDGAGNYPIIEIRSTSQELVGLIVVFDSLLASNPTIQDLIASGALPTLEDFGFARVKGFGELRPLKLGTLLEAKHILVSDVLKYHELSIDGEAVMKLDGNTAAVIAFCEPMEKSDSARVDNQMKTNNPQTPRPRALAIISSSLEDLATISNEHVVENWPDLVLTWRTSMITTEEDLNDADSHSNESLDSPSVQGNESQANDYNSGATLQSPTAKSFCGNCGNQYTEFEQNFCQSCGAPSK
jgi:hypothetical protein